MMSIRPTLWPGGFNPDDPTILMQSALVQENAADMREPVLHTHCTGQLVVAFSGIVGLALEGRRIALPVSSAIWTPPGLKHEGFLSSSGTALYLHVCPQWAAELPGVPFRIMISPMVWHMLNRFRQIRTPFEADSHLGRLAWVLLEEILNAPRLPLNFAPLPANPKLFQVAEDIVASPLVSTPISEWAARVGMSERNFSRLVLKETGMSFGRWRLRLIMLHATRLLLLGKSSEQVAEALGYETSSAFIAAFRRVFDMTPGEYRRQSVPA